MSETKEKANGYLRPWEWVLWGVSVAIIVATFCVFDRHGFLSLAASLVGVTALLFTAKGNPIGPALSIVFSGLYGFISYRFTYYGEMVTYLGMYMPMCAVTFLSWLRHPGRSRREVRTRRLRLGEWCLLAVLTAGVAVAFYFILVALDTANPIPGAIAVGTGFMACYLSCRRRPLYALVYAVNDVVLVVLWTLATMVDESYLCVTVCFGVFCINDAYAYFNWTYMHRAQSEVPAEPADELCPRSADAE